VTNSVTIAIDGMGGDHAPDVVIDGMRQARELFPKTKFQIYGQESLIKGRLDAVKALHNITDIIHTDEVVLGDDKPGQVLRRGRASSMGLAVQAVKSGDADVAVSGGNTGGLMALAKFILRTMPGIDRPALISPLPTLRGESVMLDLGANIECSAENLVQFAIMGAAYARAVLGLPKPTVGLLNVGVEELKGHEQLKNAAAILQAASNLPLSYQGFVEGDSIGKGDVDVVVTDGFTGNVALKTIEGTARFITELLKNAFTSSLRTKLGYTLAKSGLGSLREHLNPNNHNGGMLLGLNGLVVKSHGGADADGFASAITTAIDLVNGKLIEAIAEDLQNLPAVEAAMAEALVATN